MIRSTDFRPNGPMTSKPYKAADRLNAFQKAQEWGDKIPIGVIY